MNLIYLDPERIYEGTDVREPVLLLIKDGMKHLSLVTLRAASRKFMALWQ